MTAPLPAPDEVEARTRCPRCGRVHSAADTTVAGSRFVRPTAYRATYPDAPSRPTRQAAQQDMCSHHAATHIERQEEAP